MEISLSVKPTRKIFWETFLPNISHKLQTILARAADTKYFDKNHKNILHRNSNIFPFLGKVDPWLELMTISYNFSIIYICWGRYPCPITYNCIITAWLWAEDPAAITQKQTESLKLRTAGIRHWGDQSQTIVGGFGCFSNYKTDNYKASSDN